MAGTGRKGTGGVREVQRAGSRIPKVVARGVGANKNRAGNGIKGYKKWEV